MLIYNVPIYKVNFYHLLPLASLLLVACSTLKPDTLSTSPTAPQWREHQQQLKQIHQFQTRGAFAYLAGQQKIYARFFWQQYTPERYRLLLTNPLGSTELELKVQPGATELTTHQGKHYLTDDPEKMIEDLTGMSIPLESLRQWILGLPGNTHTFTLDDQYRLKQLNYQQQGQTWTVNYQGYNTQLTPQLPNRLEVRQGEQRIKLKMDNWLLK